jgi:hypothetical protein
MEAHPRVSARRIAPDEAAGDIIDIRPIVRFLNAEWPLCLTYGMLAVAHLARKAPGLLARGVAERKLVVGFNSGEPYLIGAVRARGFKPRFEVIG